ncbi:unnamed protein product [Periconia digitata]|uniref:Uncharacterized protein n=1 Tax=Periconia digitata TaxID=1303443 RepID=A0A9W4UBJ6_9PLEO|nr:unnamed protein product [Periconia digitata]
MVARASIMHPTPTGAPESQHMSDRNVLRIPFDSYRPIIPKRIPQDLPYTLAEASVKKIGVGELTGAALYNVTTDALNYICPGFLSGCVNNRKFVVPGIKFKTGNGQVENTGSIEITASAEMGPSPSSRQKMDFIHVVASVLAKQSEDETGCERVETPCHTHDCLHNISVATLLCSASTVVSVHPENNPSRSIQIFRPSRIGLGQTR